ncbi:alpha/beta hydrolase [Arthrobacter sp. zg-Y895]|uniref:alpha/beta hydrolase n=1 Tax=Arthrobacter sp. zg-Y895 TaxID=2886933 RepID=UPI001D151859|nr:alpha/beta hydrolase [Arthrobacter sp. zg-Y895]MCC3302116.1 alpha/beta hydrolase family protein [Arthrobacter sp. zg-Y895]
MTYLRHAFFVDTLELRLLPDGGPIQQKAKEILAGAEVFQEVVSSAGNRWQALGLVYQAPEQELALRAMDEPSKQAGTHLESVRVFQEALDTFGRELEEIDYETRALDEAADAAYGVWLERLDELNAQDASTYEMEAAREELNAPLQTRLAEITQRYEQARQACVRSLGAIARSSPDVISSYPSFVMDLAATERDDAIAALDKALAPDASPEDIKAFYNLLLLAGPDLMKELGKRPGAAQFVAGMSPHEEMKFWGKLSPEQQGALLVALPGLVGSLEGAPYKTRDTANRQLLGILQQELIEDLWNSGRVGTDYEALAVRQGALESLALALSKKDRYLISLDPRTDAPLAQVAVGNPDTARNVTYVVPGMYSSSVDAAGLANQADDLRKRQSLEGIYGNDTAVIAYMGYESPTLGQVTSEDLAEKGAPAFADSLDGLYLTRSAAGTVVEVNVIAHSYGTTMTAIALGQTDYGVASAVLLASAGLPEGVAVADFNVGLGSDGERKVFVTTAEADSLAPWGSDMSWRTDPADEADPWGGRVFSSDEVTVNNISYEAVEDHHLHLYLEGGTFSMKITALVTSGGSEEAVELIKAAQ